MIMLRVYGAERKLLKAVQSFQVDSMACVQVEMDVSEWSLVNVGLREGCVMSPLQFNIHNDGVVWEVNDRMQERAETAECKWYQVQYKPTAICRWYSTYGWLRGEKLCKLVSEFGRVCETIKLRGNLGISNVMRCLMYVNVCHMHMRLNGKPLEKVIVLSTW